MAINTRDPRNVAASKHYDKIPFPVFGKVLLLSDVILHLVFNRSSSLRRAAAQPPTNTILCCVNQDEHGFDEYGTCHPSSACLYRSANTLSLGPGRDPHSVFITMSPFFVDWLACLLKSRAWDQLTGRMTNGTLTKRLEFGWSRPSCRQMVVWCDDRDEDSRVVVCLVSSCRKDIVDFLLVSWVSPLSSLALCHNDTDVVELA